MSYWKQTQVTFADGPTIDAFGNARTSTPKVLFDSKMLSDDQPLRWDRVVNGATAKNNWANTISTYEVSGSGDYVIAQTKQRFTYEAGNSHRILITFVLGAPTANTTARIGYFNSSTTAPYSSSLDGIYLERDGTNVNVCLANTTKNIITAVSQSAWNMDKLDGTGPSGLTLDLTKSQIFFIDFQWLGVGRVRAGFVIGGALHYVHKFTFSNEQEGVYMRSPNHSVRYEIRSSGGTSALKHICCAVQTEGTSQYEGTITSVSSNRAGISISNTDEAIVGVRLKSSSFDQTMDIDELTVMSTTSNTNFQWMVCMNPTIVGNPLVWTPMPSASYEYAQGDGSNTVTNLGTIIDSGWVSNNSRGATGESKNIIHAGSKIDGTPDQYWIVIYSLQAGTFLASANIRET